MEKDVGLSYKRKRTSIAATNDDNEEFSVELSDISVLDCPICFEPLTIPVFQCPNGHITCFACNQSLKRKCSTCSKNLVNIRNRAIESILESIKVFCCYKSYGCQAEFNYSTKSSKSSHEETCVYAPYACPFENCNFLGSPKSLHLHLKKQHTSSSVITLRSFAGTLYCKLNAKKDDGFFVLLEERDEGAIFILDHKTMRIGCIQKPSLSKSCSFVYNFTAQGEFGSFNFKPVAYPWHNRAAGMLGTETASRKILDILDCFDRNGCTRLLISIAVPKLKSSVRTTAKYSIS